MKGKIIHASIRRGWFQSDDTYGTEVDVEITMIRQGIGEIDCVECKGTGKVMVSC